MKVTKYEHSCLVVEQNNQTLVIDPGVATKTLPELTNVAAIIITHVHADHYSVENIQKLQASNPGAVIYSVPAVMKEAESSSIQIQLAQAGDTQTIGPFTLSFFGGKHALIHQATPITDNIAVLINESFYVTGDALTLPSQPVKLLAAPITAPWLKIADVMDFIAKVKPNKVFPVHDALLSDFGMMVNNNWLQQACDAIGAEYIVQKSADSIDI